MGFNHFAAPLLFLIMMIGCGPAAKHPDATRPRDRSKDAAVVTDQSGRDELPRDKSLSDESLLDRADRLTESGDSVEAITILRELLIADPHDALVLFRLANLSAEQGSLADAIEMLEAIPEDHPEAGLAALGQTADWCFQLERYDDAERKYVRLLERAPDAALAHRQLAYLLNRQGRRHEAAVHVRVLCELGDVRQDELQSLIVLSDAMYDDPDSANDELTNPYWPIGASGIARRLFNEQRYDEVVRLLEPEVKERGARPAIVALYGRAAIEAQDEATFARWMSLDHRETRAMAEYWAAYGTYLLAECRFDEAARALGEAIDRDATDLISIGRLRQALLALAETELADRWQTRWRQIREVLRINNRLSATAAIDPQRVADIAARLDALGYRLQAVLWKSIEAATRGTPTGASQMLQTQHQQLVDSEQSFPSGAERLCGMDLRRYPLPQDASEGTAFRGSSLRATDISLAKVNAHFVDIAARMGFEHSFSVAREPQTSGFTIFQFFGGAVAVLDFDLDGFPDLYCGQGAADAPSFESERSNQLYRNTGAAMVDVTQSSAAIENRYSTGLTAGDWNQDGFADIVVCNLGGDALFLNQGDGTFRAEPLIASGSRTRVPSSVALADVTGDGLPDIFQLAYVDDPDFTRRPERNASGQVISSLLPAEFAPGADRLLASDGRGGHRPVAWDPGGANASTSLGVVIADFNGEPGNEIFIGNDIRPNQFWTRDPVSGSWVEVALPLGCAYGYTGGATASMGIAAGDFDNTGTLDLHITNYQDDAASLFLAAGGVFRDRNVQFNLSSDSRAVLGFGTQSIDFDNDGRLDIVVTNGHVEDEAGSDAEFRQPPQLFRNMEGRFELADVTDESGYWSRRHLGRALARLDFNRDGRMDIAVTHLEAPSALLLNQTETDHGWLQLQLVGTRSERDAIGASVTVTTGERTTSHWVMAGDGYMCRNEAVLAIGLGEFDHIDEIAIRWPSGERQTIRDVRANRRLMILENESEPTELPIAMD